MEDALKMNFVTVYGNSPKTGKRLSLLVNIRHLAYFDDESGALAGNDCNSQMLYINAMPVLKFPNLYLVNVSEELGS